MAERFVLKATELRRHLPCPHRNAGGLAAAWWDGVLSGINDPDGGTVRGDYWLTSGFAVRGGDRNVLTAWDEGYDYTRSPEFLELVMDTAKRLTESCKAA